MGIGYGRFSFFSFPSAEEAALVLFFLLWMVFLFSADFALIASLQPLSIWLDIHFSVHSA